MKAVSLLSGGLDSQLAVCLIKEQGIEVVGVNFTTSFFKGDENLPEVADNLGIKLEVFPVQDEYIEKVLQNPVYGYGKNLNPCIDCHAFMLKKAGFYMQDINARFLVTGEVVGQRPMSQNKSSLNAVDKLSGFRGLIVRPLSAKLLPVSIPENKGWIDRDKLLDISGRGRKQQIELAKKYSLREYPTPAGGCLLTDTNYAKRLQKILSNQVVKPENLDILGIGRHFYFDTTLLVVGRNHSENLKIENIAAQKDLLLKVLDRPGPLGIMVFEQNPSEGILKKAAAIVARYSDAKTEPRCTVKVYRSDEEIVDILDIQPLTPQMIPKSL